MPCPQHAAKTNAVKPDIICEMSEIRALVLAAGRYALFILK
jgi:hypothetical protein